MVGMRVRFVIAYTTRLHKSHHISFSVCNVYASEFGRHFTRWQLRAPQRFPLRKCSTDLRIHTCTQCHSS